MMCLRCARRTLARWEPWDACAECLVLNIPRRIVVHEGLARAIREDAAKRERAPDPDVNMPRRVK